MNFKQTFTIDLRDLYGSKLDKLAAKSDKQFGRISKGIGGVTKSGQQAAKSITDIDKRISQLKQKINLSVDYSAIRAANKEIRELQKERGKLEGLGMPGGGIGKGLGGLGKGLLVGAIATIGTASIGEAISKTIDTTAKYEKFEAVLSNTLGSRSAAQRQMQQISDFASRTPFQVDELTEAFVKLANQGFKPTMKQMTSLGDLASSTGKSYDQLAEAILDAQTGEFERLKEFGIRASVEGDKVSFTFKGQTTTVSKTADAMRNYILTLGEAKGVSGAMAKISATTGGLISNLQDNVDGVWKALGERFNPEIKLGIGALNKMVSSIKGWIEIPLEEKMKKEADNLRIIKSELTDTNISTERRKELLKEINENYGEYLKGLDLEKASYQEIQTALDGVIKLLDKKSQKAFLDKALQSSRDEYADLVNYKTATVRGIRELALEKGAGDLLNKEGITEAERVRLIEQRISGRDEMSGSYKLKGEDLAMFSQYWDLNKKLPGAGSKMKLTESDILQQMKQDGLLGLDDTTTGGAGGGGGKGAGGGSGKSGFDSAGLNSVNSGTSVKNIYVNINQLVGSYIVQTTTVKEGAAKSKDIVKEALLTAVNDANLAGGN